MRASNLGELRNNHDPSLTYEGDNNVLGQQASNWLVRQYENGVENVNGAAEFLTRKDNVLQYSFAALRQKNPVASLQCKWSRMFA